MKKLLTIVTKVIMKKMMNGQMIANGLMTNKLRLYVLLKFLILQKNVKPKISI